MRRVLALIAGATMVLSSGAHSLLGWRGLEAALRANNAPPDLVRAIASGWHFAGGAMLVFGCIVIATFAKAQAAEPALNLPTMLIALLYIVSGTWAMIVSGHLFFLVFIVPGVLLAVAALPRRSAGDEPRR